MSSEWPSDWRSMLVADAMAAIIDYRGKTPRKSSTGIPLVTAKVVKGGRLLPTTEFIAPEDYDAWMVRGLPEVGDVALTTEAPLGEVAQLQDAHVGLAQRIITLRGIPGVLDNNFLRYALQSPDVQVQLHARASGTTVMGIKQSELRRVALPCPQIVEQRAIARILSALDDKIDANRALNETLEATCQALFRSWFVDFDPVVAKSEGRKPPHLSKVVAALFPSNLVDTEAGPIPDGWEFLTISEIASLARESLNPLDHPTKEFALYSIPAFDTGVGPEGQLGAAIKSNKFALRAPCVLVSKLNPRIPRVWLPDLAQSSPAIASTEFLVVTPKDETPLNFLYQLFRSDAFIDEFATLVTGTSGSHQRVKPNDFLRMRAVVPPPEIRKCADDVFSPALDRVLANMRESRTLVALRDALLPRLLSGELRVREAEALVEEAV